MSRNPRFSARNRAEIGALMSEAIELYCRLLDEASSRGGREQRGRDLVRIVDESIGRLDLSLTQVADAFRASPAHTSRLFRQTTGVSFQDYVAAARVDSAKALLLTTHATVQDVGRQAGFAEVHTFIRTFKRRCGLTPAEYRRTTATGVQTPA